MGTGAYPSAAVLITLVARLDVMDVFGSPVGVADSRVSPHPDQNTTFWE